MDMWTTLLGCLAEFNLSMSRLPRLPCADDGGSLDEREDVVSEQ